MRKKIKKATPVRYHDGLSQLRPNAGGIDVGASEVWVDVGNRDGEPTRMFETFTADLNRMGDWLKSCGIQTVAMESTGVYWIPVCQILESKGDRSLFSECSAGEKCEWGVSRTCSTASGYESYTAMDYYRHRFGRRKTLGSCAPICGTDRC